MLRGKKSRRPNSAGVKDPDYFRLRYLQEEVPKLKPTFLESSNLAVRRGVGNVPIAMAHRADAGFPKRGRTLVVEGWSTFRHRKYDADLLDFLADVAQNAPAAA